MGDGGPPSADISNKISIIVLRHDLFIIHSNTCCKGSPQSIRPQCPHPIGMAPDHLRRPPEAVRNLDFPSERPLRAAPPALLGQSFGLSSSAPLVPASHLCPVPRPSGGRPEGPPRPRAFGAGSSSRPRAVPIQAGGALRHCYLPTRWASTAPGRAKGAPLLPQQP